jgi:FAD binding domain/D-arabinono-1,4-lactone oxidase
MTISNWNGSACCTPAEIVAPRNVDELVDVVKNTYLYPSPLRAVGELHSLNECFTTTGTIVLMHHFNEIGDPVDGRVTVGAGVRMIDLMRKLKQTPWRLQLEVVPEIGNATAGSVACCGTKDSSLGPSGLGQISSTVVGVKMIDPRGQLVSVTEAADPKGLREVRSSYGLFGVVYAVTFALRSLTKVTYRYVSLKLDPLPTFKNVLGDADGFLGFLLPYRREIIVERRSMVAENAPIGWTDRLGLRLRTKAWKTGARVGLFNIPLTGLPALFSSYLLRWWIGVTDLGLRKFFLWIVGKYTTYRVDAMIDFDRSRASYFDFTFWAFPVSRWGTVVPAYLRFCESFQRRTGFRPALPTEVYFIRQDNHGLLSFSPNEDIFTLDMVNSTPRTSEDEVSWRWMNREYNDFAATHGGRPLLNQTKELSRSVVHRSLGADWQTFAATRLLADKDGRFLNEFFKSLL